MPTGRLLRQLLAATAQSLLPHLPLHQLLLLLQHLMGKDGALDPAPATLIAEHVDSYASLGAALFYAVNAESDQDGVYVRAFVR